VCGIKKRARVAEDRRRRSGDPEWRAKRRAQQLAYYHRKKHDPTYQFERQLRDMTRFRVR
jgi:predicted Zn-dependent peptidase